MPTLISLGCAKMGYKGNAAAETELSFRRALIRHEACKLSTRTHCFGLCVGSLFP